MDVDYRCSGWRSAGSSCSVLWVLRSLRVPAPLVDLRLACARGVLGVNLAAVLLGVCVFGGAAMVILLVQRPPRTASGSATRSSSPAC